MKISEHSLIEENGFALTERILSDITPNIRMLFLCNPNNPTGQLIDPRLLRRIADKCEKKWRIPGARRMLSGIYKRRIHSPHYLRNILICFFLNAFTKLYAMAGIRLGYFALR